MARLNGGIIGKKNTTSFGKNTVTSRTSSTPSAVTTQPGTRLVDTLVVAGGGGGGLGQGAGDQVEEEGGKQLEQLQQEGG